MLNTILSEYIAECRGMGSKTARAGLAYEEFIELIFSDSNIINKFNSNEQPDNMGEQIFYQTCAKHNIDHVDTIKIIEVPKRDSGGPAKTDVCVAINGLFIKISVKQSSSASIAVAEFDVDTIKEEVGITDTTLLQLMNKFQTDASGKNFNVEEREILKSKIAPIKKEFVRWTLTGSPNKHEEDLRIANHTIMFKVDHTTRYAKSFSTYTIEQQIDSITSRASGYGTGLSWTYATGTKGYKIQFKCPVL